MKVGRNEPCPCGSGKKYKKCCLSSDDDSRPRPSRGKFRFEPGSYGGRTNSRPSIGCLREGSDEYRYVLVKLGAILEEPDRACAVAKADLNDAFARKASTGRDEEVALLLRERGYVRLDDFTMANDDDNADAHAWMADDGLHVMARGTALSPAALEEATKTYQEKLRSSLLWDEMVRKFGPEEAERLLAQCRVEQR